MSLLKCAKNPIWNIQKFSFVLFSEEIKLELILILYDVDDVDCCRKLMLNCPK